MGSRIRLHIEEEQEILREAFKAVLPTADAYIELVHVSDASLVSDGHIEKLLESLDASPPNVLLLGLDTLDRETTRLLKLVHDRCPSIGLVITCSHYETSGVKYLRRFLKGNSPKGAYLFKHSIDSVDELCRVIRTVAEGRLVIDPTLFHHLMEESNAQNSILKALTPREMEILSWMAKGYQDSTIAHLLSLDLEEIEAHTNSIFHKLSEFIPSARDARVAVVISYLKAIGAITPDVGMLREGPETIVNAKTIEENMKHDVSSDEWEFASL
jgi:DNA-binding NarL/FixJ family response regulator